MIVVNQKYVIGLDGSGIDELIKGVQEYQKWLKERSQALIQRLAEEGYNLVSAGFEQAEYDGTNDYSVKVEPRENGARAVVAIGDSVLFVEFGTGIYYPDDHPEAAENGMVRGEYGQGKGKQRTWGYYGEAGTHGQEIEKKNGKTVVLTHGNPANMPMYKAVRQLEADFERIVREVFV